MVTTESQQANTDGRNTDGRQRIILVGVGLLIAVVLAACLIFWRDDVAGGGEHFKPLQIVVDIPGIENPELIEADQARLSAATSVVGFVVNEQPIAIVIDAMEDYRKHVVNLQIEDTAVSVTYCDLASCIRVFRDQRDSVIPLRNGGLDEDNQLVLMLDNVRYGQESDAVPLQDQPFTRTSLGQWKEKYPNTKVLMSLPD